MFDPVGLDEAFSDLDDTGGIVFIDNCCFVFLSESALSHDYFVHVL